MKRNYKVLVVGDFFLDHKKTLMLLQANSGLFDADFLRYVKDADLSILNLESSLTKSKKRVFKYGPNLKGDLSLAKELKTLGFNLFTLANNHLMDYGLKGLQDTINICKKNEIATIGAGENLAKASSPFSISFNDFKICILNYSENEYINATKAHPGFNPFNELNALRKIKELKKENVFIIAILHGGVEHAEIPSPNTRNRYRFLIEAGANIVIAHHPHTISGYENYLNGSIYYSLGNFMFNTSKRYYNNWYIGLALSIEISTIKKGNYHCKILPIQTNPYTGFLDLIEGQDKDNIEKKVEAINSIITNDMQFYANWEKYIKTREREYLSHFSPIGSNLYKKMIRKFMLPNFITRKQLLLLDNIINCESHYEVIANILRNRIRKLNDS